MSVMLVGHSMGHFVPLAARPSKLEEITSGNYSDTFQPTPVLSFSLLIFCCSLLGQNAYCLSSGEWTSDTHNVTFFVQVISDCISAIHGPFFFQCRWWMEKGIQDRGITKHFQNYQMLYVSGGGFMSITCIINLTRFSEATIMFQVKVWIWFFVVFT